MSCPICMGIGIRWLIVLMQCDESILPLFGGFVRGRETKRWTCNCFGFLDLHYCEDYLHYCTAHASPNTSWVGIHPAAVVSDHSLMRQSVRSFRPWIEQSNAFGFLFDAPGRGSIPIHTICRRVRNMQE